MLERATPPAAPKRPWVGICALLVGGIALLTGAWGQFRGQPIPTVGDLYVLLPLLAGTITLGGIAFIRRETPTLPVAAIAMAAPAPLLGWVILVAAVASAAGIVLAVLAKFH
jgi:hypothetical protein